MNPWVAFATRKAGSRRQLGEEVMRGRNFPAPEQPVEAAVSLLHRSAHQPLAGTTALNACGHTSSLISKYIITSTSLYMVVFIPARPARSSFLPSIYNTSIHANLTTSFI